MKTKLLALFGESSSGKDSIRNWLIKNYHINGIISYTTRPKRENEIDGIDYYFVSKDEFMKLYLENKIMSWFTFNDWFYGLGVDSFSKNKLNVGVLNIRQIEGMLESPEIITLPIWIQAHDKTRLLRSINREKDPDYEEICRRFLADKKDFKDINFYHEIYLNDNDDNNYYGILNRPKVAKFVEGLI